MWTSINLGNIVGTVNKLKDDLENKMDNAIGGDFLYSDEEESDSDENEVQQQQRSLTEVGKRSWHDEGVDEELSKEELELRAMEEEALESVPDSPPPQASLSLSALSTQSVGYREGDNAVNEDVENKETNNTAERTKTDETAGEVVEDSTASGAQTPLQQPPVLQSEVAESGINMEDSNTVTNGASHDLDHDDASLTVDQKPAQAIAAPVEENVPFLSRPLFQLGLGLLSEMSGPSTPLKSLMSEPETQTAFDQQREQTPQRLPPSRQPSDPDIGKQLKVALEALAERERQLETVSATLAAVHDVGAKNIPTGSNNAVKCRECAKEQSKTKDALHKLRVAEALIAERDATLAQYETEGRALSLAQSDMERTVKRVRADMRTVTEERDKARSELSATMEKLSVANAQVAEAKSEAKNALKQGVALQAVGQASSSKVAALEKSLLRAQEETIAVKDALELASVEIRDLRRKAAEVEAEHGSLAAQAAAMHEMNEREQTIAAEVQRLQDALSRAMREKGLREEALQGELRAVQQRWRDAIARCETIQADAHEAAAPLLRQVTALQEEARARVARQSQFEAALAAQASDAEKRAAAAEEELRSNRMAAASIGAELAALQVAVANAQESEARFRDRAIAAENELSLAADRARVAITEARAVEGRLRGQLAATSDALDTVKHSAAMERVGLEAQLERLKVKLQEAEGSAAQAQAHALAAAAAMTADRHLRRNSSGGSSWIQTSDLLLGSQTQEQQSIDYSTHSSNTNLGASGILIGENMLTNGGNASFVALEKLKSSLRAKERELSDCQKRAIEAEHARDVLAQEVSVLGRTASEAQAHAAALPCVQSRAKELEAKNQLLLEMLGESEEACEALTADLEEVKQKYRTQITELTALR